MDKKMDSRQAVLDAASRLFHMYGFNGTSVRAIASEAGVNVALISYYFGGKKALLEQLMEHFLKGYISEIETFNESFIIDQKARPNPASAIVSLAERLLEYQAEHFYMARFVFREISLDSILTREIMTTYLMKEKYLLDSFFKELGLKASTNPYSLDFLIMQFRDMVMLPFGQPQYIRKVYGLQPTQRSFLDHYLKHFNLWAEGLQICDDYNKRAFI